MCDEKIRWTSYIFPPLITEVVFTVTNKKTGNIVEETKSFSDLSYFWWSFNEQYIQKVIIIQKYFRKYKKIKRMIRWVNSAEFNEWYYTPNNAGGKRAIQRLKNKNKRKMKLI